MELTEIQREVNKLKRVMVLTNLEKMTKKELVELCGRLYSSLVHFDSWVSVETSNRSNILIEQSEKKMVKQHEKIEKLLKQRIKNLEEELKSIKNSI